MPVIPPVVRPGPEADGVDVGDPSAYSTRNPPTITTWARTVPSGRSEAVALAIGGGSLPYGPRMPPLNRSA
jgi:hypothetical protein